MSKAKDRELAGKILGFLKNDQRGVEWYNTQQIAEGCGLDLSKKEDVWVRGLLNRLMTANRVLRRGSAKHYWKLSKNSQTWLESNPFTPCVEDDDAPAQGGDDKDWIEIKEPGTEHKHKKEPNKDLAVEALKLQVDNIDQVLAITLRKLSETMDELAATKEKVEASGGYIKTLKIEKYDGTTKTLKDKVLPARFNQVLDLARCRRNVLLVGPAGCLHPDSIIHDPVDGTGRTVEDRWRQGSTFYVTSLTRGGKLVVAPAMPPVKYDSVPMYRITTERGKKYEVTAEHRLLTVEGYVPVSTVIERLAASVPVLVPCASETYQSTRVSDGRSWTRTAEGWLFDCRPGPRSCGVPPPSGEETGLVSSPSLAGALGRSPNCSPSDARAYVQGHTHVCPSPFLPSNWSLRPPYELSGQPRTGSAPFEPVALMSEVLRRCPLSCPADGRSLEPFSSRPWSTATASAAGSTSWNPEWRSISRGLWQVFAQRSHLHSGLSLASWSNRLRSISKPSHQEVASGDSALFTPWWNHVDNIVDVVPIGCQPYFDFHVPIHNNYLHNGAIHHNCGKTYLAELVAKSLSLEFEAISCTAGMSESQLTGRVRPRLSGDDLFQTTGFLRRYEEGGLFLFDEFDAADPNLLLVVNTALANGYCNVPNRDGRPKARRHKDFVCVATANTFGRGATRMYYGRNQLDESTLDRFRIGTVECDYDRAVEAALCPDDELRGWCHKVRERIEAAGLRRVMSTRFILDAYVMRSQANWSMQTIQQTYFNGWSSEEVQKVKV